MLTPATTDKPACDSIVQDDVAGLGVVERLAACHALLAGLAEEAALPPLWHWLHFLDPVAAADLGEDGHRRHGQLMPHDPALPARMWAGGRLRFAAAPQPGETVRRATSVHGITERQGKSGKLRFMTLRHVISGTGGLLVEEDQDLVFRAPTRAPPALPAPAAPSGAVARSLVPDAVLLFRFSALTFNAHRIHYDADYARGVEHYPGLVVHGPLQAIVLTALLRLAAPYAALRQFEFRALSPAYANRALRLEAWADDTRPGGWHLRTLDTAGAACMVAKAYVEERKSVLF